MAVRNVFRLLLSIGAVYIIGIIAFLIAAQLLPTWYASLNKPRFIPSDTLFVPIGMLICFLLGLSLYLIWNAGSVTKDRKFCLYLFVTMLILNLVGLYVFFDLKSPFMALITMIMQLAIVISTTIEAFRVSVPASILLIPYLIACLIAAIASYLIIVMNPGLPLMVI
ncbi:MAG: TspO/MBR family protein [Methanoregula sp. PtaU1.Bin051]|nr:MAG: TspO/MBR family protein [Methanoregula sp. PtaU1.Bin051]